ncbi:MAG TPA: SRPBCC family protein [Acidimicrobiales bacterium]|jgi:uncharacterized protein YndB with AHSA1/START domain
MIEQDEATAVRKSITVDAPQARAFEVFTAEFDRWWPRSHHIGESDMAEAVMECTPGGRWYERDAAGNECEWGRVAAYEPPDRIVLVWQLDSEFRYDPDLVTHVEVRFVAEGPDRTRVDLEHRDLDRYGDDLEKMRTTFDSPGGWNGLIEMYAAAVIG